MLRERSGGESLWESVLRVELRELPAELAKVDVILDDDRFLAPFRARLTPSAALETAPRSDRRRGSRRPSPTRPAARAAPPAEPTPTNSPRPTARAASATPQKPPIPSAVRTATGQTGPAMGLDYFRGK